MLTTNNNDQDFSISISLRADCIFITLLLSQIVLLLRTMALAPLPPRSGVKRPTEGVGVAVMKLKEGRSPLKPGGVCGGVL